MKKFFTVFLLIAALLIPLGAAAYDFEAGGIYYNITGSNTVSVTYKDTNYNCYSGTVSIPSSVTSGGVQYTVTSIGRFAFRANPNLTAVNIPNSVTTLEYASFYQCTGLTSMSIPSSVTLLEQFVFRNCSSLTQVTFANPNTEIWAQAFQYCTSLTDVTLPQALENIGAGLFYGCTALEHIDIPSTVTSIYMYAFYNCVNLAEINIPDATVDIATDAFENTAWYDNQPDGVIYAGKVAFGYKGQMPSNTNITLASDTRAIGTAAFNGQDNLAGITIPASVCHVGLNCLGDCESLTRITVESGNTTYDSRNNCNAIIETASNTLVAGCMNTVIPNTVTGIGSYAFNYCTGLTEINLPNSITTIGERAFRGCIRLTSITIPASVNSIGATICSECYNLKTMKVANGNTTYDSRNNCNAIIETATNTVIAGCAHTVIPDGITTIGDHAFYGQFNMTYVVIPATVTSIANYGFQLQSEYYNQLKTTICKAVTPPAMTGTSFHYISYEQGVLYVPRASISAYQNDEWWGRFVDIRAIEDLKNGDVNDDGNIDISDATTLISYLLNGDVSAIRIYNADFNQDGTVDISDATRLISFLLNGY